MKDEEVVREYLARIGHRGGKASRRFLSAMHALHMVVIREVKKAARREGRELTRKEQRLLNCRLERETSKIWPRRFGQPAGFIQVPTPFEAGSPILSPK